MAVGMTQAKEFHEEISCLRNKKPIPRKSKLNQLSPFLDGDEVLRIGGRLQQSSLTFDEKHPIILPRKSHLTTLIVRDAHLKTLHGGIQSTLAFIRRKYYIIDGRNTIRQHIHKCIKCVRFRAKTMEQQMACLPAPRVCPSRPFTHTGIDYAGPIKIRTSKTRGLSSYKGYIAVFVCMATKAVHIEAVSDLTTESFLAAFKRFTARRGLCAHIYSDCGTNFKGAQRVLEEDLRKAIKTSEQHVSNLIVSDGIQWHFNPPAAPHFGGLWESAVKSIKHHMRRVIGEVTLTFEELSTVLNQVEACLNSRPLCQFTNDPQDYNALTPGHFLIGSAPINPPQPHQLDLKITPLKRWRLVDKLTRDIWKAWSSEYLSQLHQRIKWKNPQINIKPGELVLIKEENLPPSKWLLGRIIKTYPGKDNNVRVVEIQCKGNSILTRPITKLCKLPIEEGTPNEIQPDSEIHSHHITNMSLNHTSQTGKSLFRTTPATLPSRTKKRRINPVSGYSNLIPIEKQRRFDSSPTKKRVSTVDPAPATKKRFTLTEYRARNHEKYSTFWVCFLLLFLVKLAKSGYNITHPSPGLYIEHMGEAKVQRGTLRIELNFPLNTTRDAEHINNTITQMRNICKRSNKQSNEIHCEMLLHHLQEKQSILLRDMDTLNTPFQTRKKRGVFGNILQYVFGVNDEVYTDINALKQNQQNILQATQHQTSLMLTTTAQIKDLEATTQQKFNAFTTKLNQAIREINKVEGWFTSIDTNRINIHLLAAYNIAVGILEEIENRYNLLIKILLQRADLLESLTPGELMLIIQRVNPRMPPNINILPKPAHKMESNRNETHIMAYGFLYLTTASIFDVVKITPIPQQLNNNSYIVPKIRNSIIATDYNSQTYFELSEQEFIRCIRQEKHLYLCSPTVISRIDTNPSCIVDEIYHRHDKLECTYTEFKVSQTIFKHMYQMNTWLFITNKPTSAAILCNGVHEDIQLRDIGIIQIDNGCTIRTRRNMITSEMSDTIPVKATYNHPLTLNFSHPRLLEQTILSSLPEEVILKPTDHFSTIMDQEKQLQQTLENKKWRTVGHHAATGSVSVLITLALLFVAYKIHQRRKLGITSTPGIPPQPAKRTFTPSRNQQFTPRKFDVSLFDNETPASTISSEGAENVNT